MTKILTSNYSTYESSPNSIHSEKFSENSNTQNDLIPKHIFITEILEEILSDSKSQKNKLIKNAFYSKNIPNIKLVDYIERLIKYLNPEFSTIIYSLIYIDIFLTKDRENLFLTENNIFKIYLTSIVLAIKYNEDDIVDNEYFSTVGGINLKELNKLERKFFKIIDYKLFVKEDFFKLYENNFENCEK